MEIVIGIWIIPVFLTVGIWCWILLGFNYRGDYNFTPLYTMPLGAFLTSFVWMIYFATMYFLKE